MTLTRRLELHCYALALIACGMLAATDGNALPLAVVAGASAWSLAFQNRRPGLLMPKDNPLFLTAGTAVIFGIIIAEQSFFGTDRPTMFAHALCMLQVMLIVTHNKSESHFVMVCFNSLMLFALIAIMNPGRYFLAGVAVFIVVLIRFLLMIQQRRMLMLEYLIRIRNGEISPERARSGFLHGKRLAYFNVFGMAVSAATITLALFTFYVLPRPAFGNLFSDSQKTKKTKHTGPDMPEPRPGVREPGDVMLASFTEEVMLNRIGRISTGDKRVSMKVRILDDDGHPMRLDQPLHMRAIALNRYSKGSWSSTFEGKGRRLARDAEDARADGMTTVLKEPAGLWGTSITQEIDLYPVDSRCIFALPELCAVKAPSIHVGADGCAFFTYTPTENVTYIVSSFLKDMGDPALRAVTDVPSVESYMYFPGDFENVRRLALDVTRGCDTIFAKCRAIEDYLKTNCEFTQDFECDEGVDPVKHFLFTRRGGYCVHFASAMALMLRAVGIPSRVVAGFAGNEWDPGEERYIMRNCNAHAWVEAHFGEFGWITFEPSPSTSMYLPGQVDAPENPAGVAPGASASTESATAGAAPIPLLRRVWNALKAFLLKPAVLITIGILAGLVATAVLVFIFVVPPQKRREIIARVLHAPTKKQIRFYRDFLHLAARRGFVKRPADTANEFAERTAAAFPRDAVFVVAGSYNALRFGATRLADGDIARLRQAISDIQAAAMKGRTNA
jgi:transglutaminase-like putative cysteine protease